MCLCCLWGFSQTPIIDSLKKELYKPGIVDTLRLKVMLDLTYELVTSKPNQAILYTDTAIALAKKTNNSFKLGIAYNYRGMCYYFLADVDSAKKYLEEALKIGLEIENDELIQSVSANASTFYSETGDFAKALASLNRCIAIAKKNNHKEKLAGSLINLGIYYQRTSDVKKSLDAFYQALDISEKSSLTNTMASCYSNLSNSYFQVQDFDKAIMFCNKSILIYKSERNTRGVAISYLLMAQSFFEKGDYIKANDNCLLAKPFIDSSSCFQCNGLLYLTLAKCFMVKKIYDSCYYYSRKSIEISDQSQDDLNRSIGWTLVALSCNKANPSQFAEWGLNGNPLSKSIEFQKKGLEYALKGNYLEQLMQCYTNLAAFYQYQNNYKLANESLLKLINVKDSIDNDETKLTVLRNELNFESEKKQTLSQQKINDEKRKGKVLLFSSIFLFSIGFIGFIVYRKIQFRKKEQETSLYQLQLLDTEMKALRAQMNPHFIFNSLNSISNYIHHNENKVADEYLTKFAKLMRSILENSEKKEILLADDLKALEMYLQLEKLRTNDKFDFQINIDKSVDAENVYVPPLILQPFTENSIWHGFANESIKNGLIKLEFKKINNLLQMAVEDNGVGRFKNQKEMQNEKQSLGMKITNARLNLLNKEKGTNASLLVIDLEQGTRVEIKIPYIED